MIVAAGGRFKLCSAATLLEPDDQLKAWAERHVRKDPDIRWVLGNYVEANEPNSNGHTFPLEELLTAQGTLAGKPLNMMHREHYIVGAFAGAQLLHADGGIYEPGDGALAAAAIGNTSTTSGTVTMSNTTNLLYRPIQAQAQPPYVEAVAGMWHTRFPEEFYNIRRAHSEGTLFFSMEALPEEVSCPTCAHRASFAGLESETYCQHMQGAIGPKILHKPTFNGGAIIIPPVRPGWSRADITTISELLTERPEEAEQVYAQVQTEAPHLNPQMWETMMATLLALDTVDAKDYPAKDRNKMAEDGKAMPDGGFPIANEQDLRNAIQSIGRAKNPGPAKEHIKKRARALGLTDLIPDGW